MYGSISLVVNVSAEKSGRGDNDPVGYHNEFGKVFGIGNGENRKHANLLNKIRFR